MTIKTLKEALEVIVIHQMTLHNLLPSHKAFFIPSDRVKPFENISWKSYTND